MLDFLLISEQFTHLFENKVCRNPIPKDSDDPTRCWKMGMSESSVLQAFTIGFAHFPECRFFMKHYVYKGVFNGFPANAPVCGFR